MAFFDPTRPSYREDPYPSLSRLRKEDPVHWSAGLRAWIPTRYADVAEVLHDSRRFTTDPALTEGPRAQAILAHRRSMPLGEAPTLGTTSGEPHRRLRHFVNPVFAPPAVRELQPRITSLVDELVSALPSEGPFDLMTAFANPLPRRVMLGVMGFPAGEEETAQRLLATIEVARSNPAAGVTARDADEARSRAAELLNAGDTPGRATVLGALAAPGEDEAALEPDEVLSAAAHIATVGSDPTSGAIGNAVAALAGHPAAFEHLRGNAAGVRASVHELLRFDSPTHIAPRFAVDDTQLGGRRIRRGDAILAMVGAANRDPAEFLDPDVLDLGRDARRQLSFGQGEHICLGAPLAVVILETALAGLLARFETLELVEPPLFAPSIELRIPDRLVLRGTPGVSPSAKRG